MRKFGSNSAISNQVALDNQQTIWDGITEYTFPDDVGEEMEVVSSDGTDNQNILIQGLDENFLEKLGQEI